MTTNECFPLFSILPTELRFKIWTFAFYEPTVVGFLSSTDDPRQSKVNGRPILLSDHSYIAQTCREAWQVRRDTHVLAEFRVETSPPSSQMAWIDFSKTIFYFGRGESSDSLFRSLKPVSHHVQEAAIVWSRWGYHEIKQTCRRLVIFQSLQRVVLIVAHWQDLGDFKHFLAVDLDLHDAIARARRQKSFMSPLDLHDAIARARRQKSFMSPLDLSVYVGTPDIDIKLLGCQVDGFLAPEFRRMGRQPPVVEVIAPPSPLV